MPEMALRLGKMEGCGWRKIRPFSVCMSLSGLFNKPVINRSQKHGGKSQKKQLQNKKGFACGDHDLELENFFPL